MKILIVDDEAAIAQVFDQALTKAGYTVVLAATGKEALDKVNSEKPDLILLDQILPDMNGNQVLQAIKAGPMKSTPVAIISNFNQQNLIDEALKLGASEYILKYQISPVDLVEKVKQLAATKKGTGWQDSNPEGI